jgi:hypothetical protein
MYRQEEAVFCVLDQALTCGSAKDAGIFIVQPMMPEYTYVVQPRMSEYIYGSALDAGIYVVQSRMPEYVCGSANYDGIYITEQSCIQL